MKFCLESHSPELLVACFARTKQRRLPKFHSDLPLRVFPRGSRRWIWLLACSTLAAAFTARWTWTTTAQWTWPWVLSALPFCCGWYLLPVEKKREREKIEGKVQLPARVKVSHSFICSSVTPSRRPRSRSVVRIYASVRFEPSKINIFVKDCQRGGKDVTCMSAIVCFNITARTPISPTQEVGERENKLIHRVASGFK